MLLPLLLLTTANKYYYYYYKRNVSVAQWLATRPTNTEYLGSIPREVYYLFLVILLFYYCWLAFFIWLMFWLDWVCFVLRLFQALAMAVLWHAIIDRIAISMLFYRRRVVGLDIVWRVICSVSKRELLSFLIELEAVGLFECVPLMCQSIAPWLRQVFLRIPSASVGLEMQCRRYYVSHFNWETFIHESRYFIKLIFLFKCNIVLRYYLVGKA